jgi:hypothetical protein
VTPAQARIIAVLGLLVSAVAVATAVVFYLGDRDAAVQSAAAPRSAGQALTPSASAPLPRPSASPRAGAGPEAGAAPTTSPLAREPDRASAATPSATTARPELVSVRATAAVNVRRGPGTQYDVIGVLQPPDEARVTGRNADASWLAIDYQNGTGWVSAGVVEVVGDPLRAPLAEAPARPQPAAPSPSPTATLGSARPAVTATPSRVTATPAAALPDLVPLAAGLSAGGRVTVTIGNIGQGAVTARTVSIVGVDGAGGVLFSQLTAPLTIAPGAAVTVELAYRPSEPVTVTIVLNAEGAVPESNATNNLLRVTLTPR